MGYGNIVMFASLKFFVLVIGKSFVPYADVDCSIIKGIALVSRTAFLHM